MQSKISSNLLKILINHRGAEISSVINNDRLEYMWQANKDVWPRYAPVLFPVVGKLKDDFFIFEEKKYELPQHGFARDNEFEVVDCAFDSCTFQLKSTEQTKKNFPFDFIFQINYRVIENKLITNYKITNPTEKSIFFSVGAHPGFNCPLLPNESFEDYYLEFEKNSYNQTQLNNGLRLGSTIVTKFDNDRLPLKKELFYNDALVFEKNQIYSISLCSSKSKNKVTLECKDWPYFGIWSKKNCEDFICLEPWYGIADKIDSNNKLAEKDGIIALRPNSDFSCEFSIIFS